MAMGASVAKGVRR